MPQSSAVAARGARLADSHATESSTAERVTRIALLLATRGVPLARMALKRTSTRQDAKAEADVYDPAVDGAPRGAFARATGGLARAVNAVGTTIYDYSNGQYGIKPLDPKELRHARKAAEKKTRARARDDAPSTRPRMAGRARWVGLGLGALVVAGGIAVVILQREQVRAATTQLLNQGRHTMRELQTNAAHAGNRGGPDGANESFAPFHPQ